jgi:hypothetical protein
MAERLVFTLEVWVAAIAGRPVPAPGSDELLTRFDNAARAFAASPAASATAAPGTTRSSTLSASRPRPSASAVSSPTS